MQQLRAEKVRGARRLGTAQGAHLWISWSQWSPCINGPLRSRKCCSCPICPGECSHGCIASLCPPGEPGECPDGDAPGAGDVRQPASLSGEAAAQEGIAAEPAHQHPRGALAGQHGTGLPLHHAPHPHSCPIPRPHPHPSFPEQPAELRAHGSCPNPSNSPAPQALANSTAEYESLESEVSALHDDLWEQLNLDIQVSGTPAAPGAPQQPQLVQDEVPWFLQPTRSRSASGCRSRGPVLATASSNWLRGWQHWEPL